MPKPALTTRTFLVSKTAAAARKGVPALLCAVLFAAALAMGIPRAYAADAQWWTLGTFIQPLESGSRRDGMAMQANPEAWAVYAAAQEARNAGDSEVAAVKSERAINLFGARSPLAARVYLLQAKALHDLRRDHEALKALASMIELTPGEPDGYWMRAGIHMKSSNHTKALADYDAALRLSPDLVGAHINRGIALSELNRDGQALTAFEDAIKAANKRFSDIARFWQSSVYAASTPGVTDTMLALLRADHEATVAEAHVWRGRLHLVRSRYGEAAKAYDEAISAAPNYAPAYKYRGLMHEKAGHVRHARADYLKAAELDADRWIYHALKRVR